MSLGSRADARTAAAVIGVLLAVGLPVGVLWWWVAPQPTYRVESDGLYLAGSQPQAYVAADGWFLIITGLVGAIAGLVVWLRCRQTGLGGVVGLFLGGLGGAAVAAAVGLLLGRADPFAAPVGTITEGALDIRAWGVVLFEAGLAVTVWLLLDLLVLRDDAAPVVPDPGPDVSSPDIDESPPVDDRPDYGAVRDL